MNRLYTHPNPLLVAFLKDKLEQEGLRVEVKNDMASGGAGELAPTDLWPEIWLLPLQDLERAQAIVQKFNSDDAERQDWQCPQCGEKNDPSFEVCWSCQHRATLNEN